MYGITIFELLEFIIFAGLFIGFAAYESLVIPLLVIVVALVVGYFVNHLDLYAVYLWIVNNQIKTIMLILTYITVGIIWSFVKWKIFLRDVRLAVEEKLKRTSGSISYINLNGVMENLPVEAKTHKEKLIVWMMYWWVSMPTTVLGEWVVRLWKEIYNMFAGLYQRMADREMSDINAEITRRNSLTK